MTETWMAIRPSWQGTRVLGVKSDGQTLLQARLKTSPIHPKALGALLEAIALWEGETVHAVLIAGAEASSCATSLLRERAVGRPPLYELEYALDHEREHDHHPGQLGSFADLREFFGLGPECR